MANGQPMWVSGLGKNRQVQWYRFALERGYMDSMIDHLMLKPFCRLFKTFERIEDYWLKALDGRSSRPPQDS